MSMFRDARTGRFVDPEVAEADPDHHIEEDVSALRKLRGISRDPDGRRRVLTIFQEDATEEWVVHLGRGVVFTGMSLAEALNKAYNWSKEQC